MIAIMRVKEWNVTQKSICAWVWKMEKNVSEMSIANFVQLLHNRKQNWKSAKLMAITNFIWAKAAIKTEKKRRWMQTYIHTCQSDNSKEVRARGADMLIFPSSYTKPMKADKK